MIGRMGLGNTEPMRYELAGETHVMSSDEAEAIERSGKCSWMDYATISTQYDTPCARLYLLHERLGKTEPGEYPIHGTLRGLEGNRRYHWARNMPGHNVAWCGVNEPAHAFNAHTFARYFEDRNVCVTCAKKYRSYAESKYRTGKIHWDGSQCVHVIGGSAWMHKHRITDGQDFDETPNEDRCQNCYNQFLLA